MNTIDTSYRRYENIKYNAWLDNQIELCKLKVIQAKKYGDCHEFNGVKTFVYSLQYCLDELKYYQSLNKRYISKVGA